MPWLRGWKTKSVPSAMGQLQFFARSFLIISQYLFQWSLVMFRLQRLIHGCPLSTIKLSVPKSSLLVEICWKSNPNVGEIACVCSLQCHIWISFMNYKSCFSPHSRLIPFRWHGAPHLILRHQKCRKTLPETYQDISARYVKMEKNHGHIVSYNII